MVFSNLNYNVLIIVNFFIDYIKFTILYNNYTDFIEDCLKITLLNFIEFRVVIKFYVRT
jgi:hypothetical protein